MRFTQTHTRLSLTGVLCLAITCASSGILLSLSGCTTASPYQKPELTLPEDFQGNQHWKPALLVQTTPMEDPWTQLNDTQLKNYLAEVANNNLSIVALAAQYRAALASVQKASAATLPSINTSGSANHGTLSNSSSFSNGSLPKGEIYALGASASWELDVWGRIQRDINANEAQAQATQEDWQAAKFSTQALFATSYVQLRALDKQHQLLVQTEQAYARFFQLTQARQRAGVASPLDAAQAETQWRTTQAQILDLSLQRAQLQNACAILLGKAPSQFALTPQSDYDLTPVDLPKLIPSQQVEHRPDILAAERRVAAAKAQIGLAETAFFPTITLGANANYRNTDINNLISLPNTLWSVGPTLALNLFDGGARQAAVDTAQANYEQAVANYRQTVLTVFEEVENNLIAAHLLQQEKQAQMQAVKTAQTALRIAQSQYRAGINSALNVITAQTALWSNEKNAIDLWSRHLQSNIMLIKSLGGKPSQATTTSIQ